MSRARSYIWRGTLTQIISSLNHTAIVSPDGDPNTITATGVVVFVQYAAPAVGDRVQVLAVGRQHYAQGKIV